MTVIDVSLFELSPIKDHNNILFNDLINVEPYIQPWRTMNHRRDLDMKWGDLDRHFLRKRKGFQRVHTYISNLDCSLEEEPVIENYAEDDDNWQEGEYTDMMIFEGHRRFLRRSKNKTKLRLYVQWFVNSEECSDGVYYPITAGKIVNVTKHLDEANGKDYLPTSPCSFNRFLRTWGLRFRSAKEEKNLNKGKWILKYLGEDDMRGMWVLYNKEHSYDASKTFSKVMLRDSGMVVSTAGTVCDSIRDKYGLPEGAFFVSGAMANQYYMYDTALDSCKAALQGSPDPYENEIIGGITVAERTGETLSFIGMNNIYTIGGYGQKTSDDFSACYNIMLQGATPNNDDLVITGATEFGGSLVLVRNNGTFIIGETGENMHRFPATRDGDANVGIHTMPYDITDVIDMVGHLILIGPHSIYYYTPGDGQRNSEMGVISDVSGYFCPGSWFYKDGKLFIVRSYNDLYFLEVTTAYGHISWNYVYYSGFINSQLRHLDKTFDKVAVDLTDNEAYLCIHDNNYKGDSYSKILIQDRHYNFWYTWIIDGCRIQRVKQGVFFGDWIYDNTGNVDHENEIREIISGTFGDETISATKHFVQWKMALGMHSKITNDTKIETTILSGGEELTRIVPITSTRYPTLLHTNGVAKSYDIGKNIMARNKEKSYSFQNEIKGYRSHKPETQIYDPLEQTKVSSYAPIREPVNETGEIIKFVITANGTDEVEFGGILLTYYPEDFDFGDIADTNITMDSPTYQSEEHTSSLEAVEDPEILGHF